MAGLNKRLFLSSKEIIAQAIAKFQEFKKEPEDDLLILDDSRMVNRKRQTFPLTM